MDVLLPHGDSRREEAYRREVASYLGGRWKQRARALRKCGRDAVRLKCHGCGAGTLIPYRCRSRTCPHAQRAGAAAMIARLLARVRVHDLQQAAQPWDGHGRAAARSWRLVTLTYPKPPAEPANLSWSASVLRYRIRDIRRAWSRFWRLTQWGRQVMGEKGKRARRDTSAIMAVEVGPGGAYEGGFSSGGSVHIHALVYGEYVSQPLLEALWSRALGTRARVDVRAIEDPEEGLKEVVKYVSKGVGDELLAARRAANLELAFRHVHRVSMRGALRRIRLTPWDSATEDVRPEDVHDHRVAACEDCGCVGWWSWEGVAHETVVKANGGFGFWRGRPPPLPECFRS